MVRIKKRRSCDGPRCPQRLGLGLAIAQLGEDLVAVLAELRGTVQEASAGFREMERTGYDRDVSVGEGDRYDRASADTWGSEATSSSPCTGPS